MIYEVRNQIEKKATYLFSVSLIQAELISQILLRSGSTQVNLVTQNQEWNVRQLLRGQQSLHTKNNKIYNKVQTKDFKKIKQTQ